MQTQAGKKSVLDLKNIRIRMNSYSNFKEKQNLSIKLNPLQTKIFSFHQTFNIQNANKSSTTSVSQKSKFPQNSRKFSILMSNKKKKDLIVLNKESRLLKETNSPKGKEKQKSESEQIGDNPKIKPLRHLIQLGQQIFQQEDQIPIHCAESKCRHNSIMNLWGNNDLFQHKKLSFQSLQDDFQNYKKECKKIFNDRGQCEFAIEEQFSLTINQNVAKVNVSSQTLNFSVQDKYYDEYMKYRKLKQRSFSVIKGQEDRIRRIMQGNDDVDKNYQQLIAFMQEGPQNDREKRILGLSKELTSQANFIQKGFHKIGQMVKQFQENDQSRLLQIKKRQASLITSIDHMLQAALYLTQKRQTVSDNSKLQRILQRAKNHLSILQKFTLNPKNFYVSILLQYNKQITNLQQDYDQFSKSFLQNRVLLYNCVRQIQKIPTLMVMLFGFDEGDDHAVNMVEKSQIQHRLDEYMTTQCEQCYHMKKKIKMMQFHNQKVKPVMRSLEWLIRDSANRSSCLQII